MTAMEDRQVFNLSDVVHHRDTAIKCPLKGIVVRRLHFLTTGEVEIDACDGSPPLRFPISTPVRYEPWFMDRGSLLFPGPDGRDLKLCTEFDVLVYEDGREFRLVPGKES